MDEEELVAIIEQPDGSMLDTPVRVARNGGACRVRSNAEGSTSVRMHAAGVWACRRVQVRAGVRRTHRSLTLKLAYNTPSWAGLLHDRGQVGLASGHDLGNIRPSFAKCSAELS